MLLSSRDLRVNDIVLIILLCALMLLLCLLMILIFVVNDMVISISDMGKCVNGNVISISIYIAYHIKYTCSYRLEIKRD